ncbi:uncharacterized protein [Pocillopora verrucosa]|uniref:uncharacterized protein isoform X3 n=1 Tax=Pocillopora verrucosa TaxID=203993 RepID=UPI00333F416F
MAEQSEKREQFSDSSESNSSQPRRKKRRFSDDPQDPHDAYCQKIREKGKTNVTVQKRCLQLRADTLYQKHYYDVIVFFHSCVPGRETDRHIFDYYGTPGSGRLFLKDAENEKSQSHGETVLRALKRFYYEQPPSERTTGSSSVNPAAARDGPSTEPTNSESVNPAAARAGPSAKPSNSESVNSAAARAGPSAKPTNSDSVNPAAGSPTNHCQFALRMSIG